MEPINNFTNNMILDCHIIDKTTEDPDIRELRVTSLALRVFGSLILAATAITFVVSLPASLLAPVSLFTLIITSVFFMTLAHDLIKTGVNIRNLIALADPIDESQGFIKNGLDIAKKTFHLGQKVYEQSYTEVPIYIKNTFIFEPVYRMCNSPKYLQENQYRHR